ncbi:MAG: CDP-alcohol phosphatidyltransferase family protein, partial [Candidatus Limousia pullorum]
SALICMVELGWTYSWVVAVIVAREFMVSGIRLVAAGSDKKIVIAASIWGKLKTASTMVAIIVIFLMYVLMQFGVGLDLTIVTIIRDVLMYISCALTVVSGVQYLWSYRSVIDTNK